jgi:hypothetical protein
MAFRSRICNRMLCAICLSRRRHERLERVAEGCALGARRRGVEFHKESSEREKQTSEQVERT